MESGALVAAKDGDVNPPCQTKGSCSAARAGPRQRLGEAQSHFVWRKFSKVE
jgi:hypothetical protein